MDHDVHRERVNRFSSETPCARIYACALMVESFGTTFMAVQMYEADRQLFLNYSFDIVTNITRCGTVLVYGSVGRKNSGQWYERALI